MTQVCLRDEQNHVTYQPSGSHLITPIDGMQYLGFMTEGQGQLYITGAKYPLTSANFFPKKMYGSNAFIGQPVEVTLDRGYLIVIQSKDGEIA